MNPDKNVHFYFYAIQITKKPLPHYKARALEKIMTINYYLIHGKLPPGMTRW